MCGSIAMVPPSSAESCARLQSAACMAQCVRLWMPQYTLLVLLRISLGHSAALSLQRLALRARVHYDVPLALEHVDAQHPLGVLQHHCVQLAQLYQSALVVVQALAVLRSGGSSKRPHQRLAITLRSRGSQRAGEHTL